MRKRRQKTQPKNRTLEKSTSQTVEVSKIEEARSGSPMVPILATILCLAPFLNKPINFDDPLFVWAAKQISSHPLDFYGFSLNWYGTQHSMADVMKNPPLASYYIALVGPWCGWTEIGIHLAFLLPALAAVMGTYFLARQFRVDPVPASLATLLTPVFLVCSSTVMSDTLMLAFWIWAMVVWTKGLEEKSSVLLFSGAVLTTLAALTKYFAITLIPLLLVYSIAKRRRFGVWLVFLIIPAGLLFLFQVGTEQLYGHGLLSDAISYAGTTRAQTQVNVLNQLPIGIVYLGGCILGPFFLLAWDSPRKALLAWMVLPAVLMVLLASVGSFAGFSMLGARGVDWLLVVQTSFFLAAGLTVLSIAFYSLFKTPSPESLLLLLWIAGTYMFATVLNWTVSGRNLLPIAPAAAILSVRLARDRHQSGQFLNRTWWWRLLPAGVISLLVAFADLSLAQTVKAAPNAVRARIGETSSTLWFQGHWGFQYYMEQAGGRPIDMDRGILTDGDWIISPANNTNTYPLRPFTARLVETVRIYPLKFLTTSNAAQKSGFYSSIWGPLPFTFGTVQPEEYQIHMVTAPGKLATQSRLRTLPIVQILELRRDPAEAEFYLAYEFAMRSKLDEAIHHYERALELRTSYPEADMNLGIALALKGKTPEALVHYLRALQVKPDYVEVHINMGIELATAGRIEEAIDHFKEAIRLRPNSAEAHFDLGKAYVLTGEHAKARQELEFLENTHPEFALQLKKMIAAR